MRKYKNCKDHLGHEFQTQKDMCKYWNINSNLFVQRIHSGWDLKRALTEPVLIPGRKGYQCEDHLEHVFSSIRKMCAYWGITTGAFYYRQRLGLSLKQILATPTVVKTNNF